MKRRNPRRRPGASFPALLALAGLVPASLVEFALARPSPGSGEEAPLVLGHVRFHQKISQTEGGLQGDLDGNGAPDLVIGDATEAFRVVFLHPAWSAVAL